MMDHVAKVNSRIYAQYRDKTKLAAWLRITAHLANQFEPVAEQVADSYDIDNAAGRNLDIIGRVVGVSRAYGSPAESLSDDLYRMVIKSRIWKNHTDATIDNILLGIEFITGAKGARLIDNENMTFAIEFTEELTDLQRDAITYYDVVPRPQGVLFGGFDETILTGQWGGSGAQFGRGNYARYLGG